MKTKKKKTEQKISKKQKQLEKQTTILLIVLVLIVASFGIVYLTLKPKPYFDYEGFRVYRVKIGENLFLYSIPLNINIGGIVYETNAIMRNDPYNVENISVNIDGNFFKTRRIWLTMAPDLKAKAIIAASEIGKFAGNLKLLFVGYGVTYPIENKTANIVTCLNSTKDMKVILLKLGSKTKIYNNKGNPDCVIIEGESYDDMIKATDRFVLEWLFNIRY